MKARAWIELGLHLPFSHHDLLTGQLATLGFSGFLQENASLKCFLPKDKWTNRLKEQLQKILSHFKREFPLLDVRFQLTTVREQNWNRAWKNSINSIGASEKIVIKPSWRKTRRQDRGKIVIEIDPKMSFGTAHHETTRLSLRLLEEHLQPRASVLDFGSGTGILAIAAVKLGARHAIAIDNDGWATSNATENVRRNAVRRKVRVLEGSTKDIPRGMFELIVANIDLPTILQSLQWFVKHLKTEGILILSGLLIRDLPTLLPQLSHRGLVPLGLIGENEWVALSLVRSS
ncbi:MAG: 50S ribosomal protein L11 methyltransferase [Ignavibacteriales bacterium]|nr:50S ribosomal protein L11 methyltransferase [Ignavibacteriales bacterium]